MDFHPDQTMYSPMIDRAIGFAARKHEGQRRKVGGVPYIAHPLGVAAILMQMGCREEIITAAILHDVLEDTDATLQDIRLRFGSDVAAIVEGCTELPQKGNSWEKRKMNMVKRLRGAPLDVKLVVAADKYHNLHHISRSYHKNGAAVWSGFGRGVERQAWYYRAVLESLLSGLPESAAVYPVFAQLAAIIDKLFEGVPDCPPHLKLNLISMA